MSLKKKTGFWDGISMKACLVSLASSALLAFGLYNVHAQSGVTEGGILGAVLLLEYWFDVSPAISGMVMNLACYAMGWKLFGKPFLVYSFVSAGGFSVFYGIFEQFDPIFPQIAQMPLTAAVVGALFVGVSAGICVRLGGAPGGDDALAMSMSHLTGMKIQWAYMLSDLVVLVLSLSYIPLQRILYSLLTVTLSGPIIGLIQNFRVPAAKAQTELTEG